VAADPVTGEEVEVGEAGAEVEVGEVEVEEVEEGGYLLVVRKDPTESEVVGQGTVGCHGVMTITSLPTLH
jgi:hypothetical protein